MTPQTPLTDAVVEALLVDSGPWLSCDDSFDQADAAVEGLLTEDQAQTRVAAAAAT